MQGEVDKIVIGRYIITLDEFNRVISKGAIAIRNGIIVDVGEYEEVLRKYRAEEVIERKHHVIIPGLLDCHTHTQQYLLRSAISDIMLQLPPIWTKVLVPFERTMGEDLARLSTQASIVNMLKNGITYFIEAGAPYPEILAQEVLKAGIKGVITYATYNIADDKVAETCEVLEKIRELYERYSGKVHIWMSIRQVMMATEDLIDNVIELSRKYSVGLTLHLSEYQGEVDYTLAKYGKRPLEYMLNKGISDIKPVVIAHGVFFSPNEIELVKKYELGICWCPTVDAWLMGLHWAGFTNINNIKLGIGSDGGAWGKIDLLHEVKVAKALGKAVANAITYFKAGLDSTTLLNMITGSKGSIVGEKIGRIERGYAADLVILDYKSTKILPIHNPIDLVVNYLEGDNVTDVFIDGRLIVENGKVTTIDEEKITEELLNREDEIREVVRGLIKKLKITQTPT
ncbi:MAG: amidohydrolase family protein [Desulfurococcaceae archaeon]|jgi:5-methylthioadenosine/S-adenosylhomocysteine deaminase|nr:amidohydrolase family protein [Desulfurococcaceae archaeon]